MSWNAITDDVHHGEQTMTRESYLRRQGKVDHPVGWKPNHYAPKGVEGQDERTPSGGTSANHMRVSS